MGRVIETQFGLGRVSPFRARPDGSAARSPRVVDSQCSDFHEAYIAADHIDLAIRAIQRARRDLIISLIWQVGILSFGIGFILGILSTRTFIT